MVVMAEQEVLAVMVQQEALHMPELREDLVV
jgi:hypothetical protein